MRQQMILKAIAEGFQKTTSEYLLEVSMISGLLISLILVSIFYNIHYKKKKYRVWHQEYEDMIRKYDLTINEIDFIDELALFLIDRNRKTLILKNMNTFQSALSQWKKKGKTTVYSDRLLKKLFGIEANALAQKKTPSFGNGRPARFVASDGKTFSGFIGSRDEQTIRLDHILEGRVTKETGFGQVFIQDYKGIISKPVTSVKELNNGSKLLSISNGPSHKDVTIPDIYIFVPGTESPIKTRLLKLKGKTGIIENPGLTFKQDQTLKIAFQADVEKSYRVNAMVTGISLNKSFIRLQLGYLKKS